ncbi:MAG: deoxyribonuclease IV [Acidobacteriota bacterium]|nr:deoxyribonuclease IV [Acidobacteriota bacterium]
MRIHLAAECLDVKGLLHGNSIVEANATIKILRIGIHTSKAGSFEKAALTAAGLGANTFQIFSSSPRMWRASIPDREDVARFRKVREHHDLTPLAIHVNYLVNLATLDPVIREKSITAFRGELDRAATVGAEYLVVHPGNYKGQSIEQGMAAFALGMAEAAEGFRASGLTVLLENTVGCGAQIGCRFEQLRAIRDLAARETDLPTGYCLDTCHLLSSGFDIASATGLKNTVESAGAILGMENIKVIHTNDSKTPLGSRVDRHANIGEGYIGAEGFRRILAHAELRGKAFILETPVDEEGDDRRNLETVRKLCSSGNMSRKGARKGA